MTILTLFLVACMSLTGTICFSQPGTLDSTFGDDGKVTTAIHDGASALSVAIQGDGKIVLGGDSYESPFIYYFALTRYQTNGSLDSSFGVNGIVSTDLQPEEEQGVSVAIQTDGKIVLAGTSFSFEKDFEVIRYYADGQLDTSFGNKGYVTTTFESENNLEAMLIQPDGKILATGYAFNNVNYDIVLARYNTDGTPDQSFGDNGKIITDFGAFEKAMSLGVQADGKIIVAGFYGLSFDDLTRDHDFLLVRYKPNGEIDTSFGSNGKVLADLGADDFAYGLAMQADGKIIAAGKSGRHNFADFALARYNDDGSPDLSFGVHGNVLTDFDATNDAVRSIKFQGDGKIVAAGFADYKYDHPRHRNFAIARYDPDGKIDSGFGTHGMVMTDFGSTANDAYSLAIQSDGKIVAAGVSDGGLFAVARYNNDGVLAVSIINVKAYSFGGRVQIDWTALNESNISQYRVERSVDGKNFISLGNVNALGNGQAKIDYTFTDFSPAIGDNFYRIESLSKDGATNYTNTVKVNFAGNASSMVLSPNPARNILRIDGLSSSTKTISVLDATGKLLQQITTSNDNYVFNIKQLAAGLYFIRIEGGGETSTMRFLKE
ncbi:MAG TPA: T9SS type A sorting domain-containing protein [Parafilimonas sp.]|nr:T9SS type A sorting domain-containing protein [Parafilimonas sp.]